MSSNITKTVLGGLLPFITNPATLAIIGISAVGLTVYDILTEKKDDQSNGSDTENSDFEPLIEPFTDGSATVSATVHKPLETAYSTVSATVCSTDKEPFLTEVLDGSGDASDQHEAISPDTSKKELIRQAMSELGKRSAAARARKKSVV